MRISNVEYGTINDRISHNKCVFLRGLSRSEKVAATWRCAGACVCVRATVATLRRVVVVVATHFLYIFRIFRTLFYAAECGKIKRREKGALVITPGILNGQMPQGGRGCEGYSWCYSCAISHNVCSRVGEMWEAAATKPATKNSELPTITSVREGGREVHRGEG